MKKVLALALVAVMALALCGTAFAAAGDLAADSAITITGLASGDDVYLYKVIEVNAATGGWKLADGFTGLSSNASIAKIIGNDKTFDGLTKADVEAITTAAKAISPAPTATTLTSGTFTKTVDPGMYLALVAPADANTVYNPIIVSADYTAGGSNSIDSSATLGTSAVTKKETVTLEKTTPDYTLDAGEIVMFTVTTTIPAYANSYKNPKFNVSDQLSAGLKFVVDDSHPFTVSSGNVSCSGGPSTNDTSFTLTFTSSEIAELVAPQPVTITYYAKLTNEAPYTVNEEQNDVTVEFSNNPKDDTDHGHLKDIVKEYTFTIDGSLFGDSSWHTSELVKVGLDANDNPIESVINESNGSEHAALAGAVFGLYTTREAAEAGGTNYYTNAVFNGTVTTDAKGLMEIKGLDEGTYYLKELSAPNGYIKDPGVHYFTIEAVTEEVSYSETLSDGCVVSYKANVLKSYTVTVDGTTASTYTSTLAGPSVTRMSPSDSSSDIVNTKGLELPSTGGIGTTIFYVAGLIMVLGAATILVARRKADAE